MRVEAFDGFKPPSLSFFALIFCPDDRLPVWSQDKPRACVCKFNTVSGRFPNLQEKCALDCMFVRSGFNMHTCL